MKTTKEQRGFVRGIIYPVIAIGLHGILGLLIHTGWLTDAGALALTGFVGYIDHLLLPKIIG